MFIGAESWGWEASLGEFTLEYIVTANIGTKKIEGNREGSSGEKCGDPGLEKVHLGRSMETPCGWSLKCSKEEVPHLIPFH